MFLPALAMGAVGVGLISILRSAGPKLTAREAKAAEDFLDSHYADIPLPKVISRFLDRPMQTEKCVSKRAVAYVFRAHEVLHTASNAAVLSEEVIAAKPDLTGAYVQAPNWFFKSDLEMHHGIIMRRSTKAALQRGKLTGPHWEVVFPVEHDCVTYHLPEKDLTSWPIALAPFREQPNMIAGERRRARASAAATTQPRRSARLAAKNNPAQPPEAVPTPPQSPRRPAAAPRPTPSANRTPPSRRHSPHSTSVEDSTPPPERRPPCAPCYSRHEPAPAPMPETTSATAYVPPHRRTVRPVSAPASAAQPRASTCPAVTPYVDVAFFGLGTHGGPHELAAATQTVINWLHSALGINLGSIEVIKRTSARCPQPGRTPDIVIVRMTRPAKRALFNAKRTLAGHVPVSICIHKEGAELFQHCQQRRACRAAAAQAAVTPMTTASSTPVAPLTAPRPRAALAAAPVPRPAPAPRPAASGASLNPAAAPYTGPAAAARDRAAPGQGQGSNPPQHPTSGPGEGSGSGSGAGAGPSTGGGGGTNQE